MFKFHIDFFFYRVYRGGNEKRDFLSVEFDKYGKNRKCYVFTVFTGGALLFLLPYPR